MHERTRTTLKILEDTEWFSRVGQPEELVRVLNTWQQAIDSCRSDEWSNAGTEAMNRLCGTLFQIARERFSKWNNVVEDVRPAAVSLVLAKTTAIVELHRLPPIFVNMVRSDILGVCMEAEYADLVQPQWFDNLAYWYVHGHFPCGWEGVFPKGRLIVY